MMDAALKEFCAHPKNRRCIDILEQLGAIDCFYYEADSILLTVHPSKTAELIEFNMGVALREKMVSFLWGLAAGLALWACTALLLPWLLSLLNKVP